jgi:TatD DNase family protein
MTVPLIDSHCHLHYDYAPKGAADVVREAELAGLTALITVGTDLASIEPVQAISARFANVYHTVGVHPHDVSALKDEDLTKIEDAAKNPKCRAIGEIGLDYYYEHSPKELQRRRLEQQLDLARRIGLPVVIHAREAESDLLEALTRYAKSIPAGRVPGIIHCFTGTYPFGKACLDLGFYISFSGILTFKNAEDLRSIARALPLDRLLVETDSPYLAPIPYRGKKCEPSMVVHIAMKLAEVRGVSLAEVAQATTANAKRAFGI